MDFPQVPDSDSKRTISDEDEKISNFDTLIHTVEKEAYASVMRAFLYRTNNFTLGNQIALIALIKELMITEDEHKELLNQVNSDALLNQFREWKSFFGYSPERCTKSPSPTVPLSSKIQMTSQDSQLVKDQPLAGLSSAKSVQDPSIDPTKAATLDPLIGKKVSIKWPELGNDNKFYDADITDYEPAMGKHKVVYDANKPTECYEWIDLKKVLREDVQWKGIDHTCIPHIDQQNEQNGNNDDTTGGREQAPVNAISRLSDSSDGNNDA